MGSRRLWAAALIALASPATAQTPPGSALSKGMKLVYAAGGNEQAPWVVDSIALGITIAERSSCSFIRFSARDVRRLCAVADTQFSWSEQQSRLIPTRPVGARMTLRVPTSNGGHAIYETGAVEKVTVSGLTFECPAHHRDHAQRGRCGRAASARALRSGPGHRAGRYL